MEYDFSFNNDMVSVGLFNSRHCPFNITQIKCSYIWLNSNRDRYRHVVTEYLFQCAKINQSLLVIIHVIQLDMVLMYLLSYFKEVTLRYFIFPISVFVYIYNMYALLCLQCVF